MEKNSLLDILDLNYNHLEEVRNVRHLRNLTDFWVKYDRLSDWSWVDELQPRLRLVYLDTNPFFEAKDPSIFKNLQCENQQKEKRITTLICKTIFVTTVTK